MIISHPNKFIFLHLPKNAGTSIEGSLTGANDWKTADKHLTATESIEKFGQDVWREYFTFCFVRNPWDRLVSQFRFNGETWCKRYFGHSLGFNDFVKKVVAPGLPFSRHDYLSKIGSQYGGPVLGSTIQNL